MPETQPIIAVEGVKRHYKIGWKKHVRAVDGVSLEVHPGETLALVGESGCGKSTLARLIMRLEPATAGRILLEGQDITALRGAALQSSRRQMQMVFQDPYASVNPRLTAEDIVREPLDNFRIGSPEARRTMVRALLGRVGLSAQHATRYPHELSGGQRQRLGIARALALNPKLIVADEPVSALDLSIQAQVINLLRDLQAELGLSMLFVSHDIGVVAHVSHRVAVMYLGRIVETGTTADVVSRALHPYTRALIDAVPVEHPSQRRVRRPLEGDLPSPLNPPSGCRFNTRCPHAEARCRIEEPVLRGVGGEGHQVACHLLAEDGSLPAQKTAA
ncbi:ABC transporter ATP-binding protein [Microvirga splendida]|uniref:ATP-binding cassette domain-containing protein n=1 Tax=Microvirga splendida TaxID=2795727 RepID=A0ABS0Y382_9HYPH|nr:oligopeptide/dipeptide ABC transporter ATP-binding protein [Microvirga splendida]MBJ6126763.1 ATP-binding cassette domain-containing protein [Microvirga splendida]